MKKFLKKFLKFIGDHLFASQAKLARKKELRKFSPIYKFQEEQFEESYNYFKKFFFTSMLFDNHDEIRDFSIKTALENHFDNALYLEFGVATGNTINFFSKYLSDEQNKNIIYGFDNFTGNTENWIGNKTRVKGAWNRNGKPPKVNHNVELVIGDIQETLIKFLEQNPRKINFIHIDVNTYETTNFILMNLKPYINDKCVIIFDDYHNLPNWKHGEHAALLKNFSNDEFKYIAFHSGNIATVQITKK